MIVKASISFLTADPDAVLIVDNQTVITSMTDNEYYTTPNPTLALVTAGNEDFAQSVSDAADGGKTLNSIKNAKRAIIVDLMRQLASYVTVACGGDMTKLLSSGFPVQTPNRTKAQIPATPVTPVLTQGKTGELNAGVKPSAGTYIYNWRVALASAPGVYVQHGQSTKGQIGLTGLTVKETYNVEANAVGTAGASDWSGIATMTVI